MIENNQHNWHCLLHYLLGYAHTRLGVTDKIVKRDLKRHLVTLFIPQCTLSGLLTRIFIIFLICLQCVINIFSMHKCNQPVKLHINQYLQTFLSSALVSKSSRSFLCCWSWRKSWTLLTPVLSKSEGNPILSWTGGAALWGRWRWEWGFHAVWPLDLLNTFWRKIDTI